MGKARQTYWFLRDRAPDMRRNEIGLIVERFHRHHGLSRDTDGLVYYYGGGCHRFKDVNQVSIHTGIRKPAGDVLSVASQPASLARGVLVR